MTRRRALSVLLPAVVVAAGGFWYRVHQTRAFFELHALLSRFPADEATVVRVDVSLLRAAGLFSEGGAAPEAEYKQFLDGSGFNYKHDLDSVVGSFSDKGSFFIARGRFDWARLREYAVKQGGSCYQDLCRMQGSTADRHISFLPLRDDALGLAVSTNDLAAAMLARPGPAVSAVLPRDPVWVSLPGSVLRGSNSLPGGLRYLLSALQSTERVLLTAGPVPAGIEARFETTCRTPDEAKVLASQLRIATSTLKDGVARDRQIQNDELAVALSSGNFDQTGRKVIGRWPLKKSLFGLLTQGI